MSRRRVSKNARARAGGGQVLAIPPTSGNSIMGPDGEWFGPGRPMQPIAPPSVAGRRYDFMHGQNMQITPRWDAGASFQMLRALADGHDITRLAIETRKDQMSRLSFTFRQIESEEDLSEEQKARALRYRRMLRRPDGENFWADWLRMLLEDLLVIDAPTIFIQRTMDETEILGLHQIDGATIKPLIDAHGRTPRPPEVAYQQILHGMNAVDYTAEQLVYRPRNRRVHRVYGFSPVEQILATINLALRRQMWQHAYFTNGNLPDSLIGVPATWTPDQISAFQMWFDSVLTGNTDRRRGAVFVPGEVAKSYVPTKDAEMFGAAEEWLARVVCYCFGISHQALVKEVNRATADTAAQQALDDGLAPIMGWVKSLMDGMLMDHFGEVELEFVWEDDKETDPAAQDALWKGRVDAGMAPRNEWRGAVGLDPRPEPEADMLMVSGQVAPLSTQGQIEQQEARQESGVFPAAPTPGSESGGSEAPPSEEDGGAATEDDTEAAEKGSRPFVMARDGLGKYSEDQPRADNGQFGEGGGSGEKKERIQLHDTSRGTTVYINGKKDSSHPTREAAQAHVDARSGTSAQSEEKPSQDESKTDDREPVTGNAAHDAAAPPDLSQAETDALKNYAGASFRDMNPRLREGKNVLREDRKDLQRMDEVFARQETTEPITVYRGVSSEVADQLQVGASFEDRAFTSTSSSKSGASNFVRGEGAALMEIRVPAGSPALSIRDLSVFGKTEQEILLGRGGRYSVVSRTAGTRTRPPVIVVEYRHGE